MLRIDSWGYGRKRLGFTILGNFGSIMYVEIAVVSLDAIKSLTFAA